MQTKRLSHARLYQLRLKSGKSQGDVAYELRQRGFKVDATSISRWERGEHTPKANVMPALAAIYGVTIDELYSDSDGNDDDEEADQAMRLRRFRAELVLLGRDDLAEELKEIARVTGGIA